MFFKDRSFQVKVVKDQQNSGQPLEPERVVDKILVAQSYADLVVDTATQLAKVAVTVIIVKAGCDFINTVARSFAK